MFQIQVLAILYAVANFPPVKRAIGLHFDANWLDFLPSTPGHKYFPRHQVEYLLKLCGFPNHRLRNLKLPDFYIFVTSNATHVWKDPSKHTLGYLVKILFDLEFNVIMRNIADSQKREDAVGNMNRKRTPLIASLLPIFAISLSFFMNWGKHNMTIGSSGNPYASSFAAVRGFKYFKFNIPTPC